jgi:hypothetical protein
MHIHEHLKAQRDQVREKLTVEKDLSARTALEAQVAQIDRFHTTVGRAVAQVSDRAFLAWRETEPERQHTIADPERLNAMTTIERDGQEPLTVPFDSPERRLAEIAGWAEQGMDPQLMEAQHIGSMSITAPPGMVINPEINRQAREQDLNRGPERDQGRSPERDR